MRYAGPTVVGAYNLDAPEAHRLPPKQRLDVGLSWHYRLRVAQLQVQWMMRNALNHPNVYDCSLAWMEPAEPILLNRRLPGRQWLFAIQLTY